MTENEKRKRTLEELDALKDDYLETQGENAELIRENILAWRKMMAILNTRSTARFHRGDSMVKYNPIQGKGLVLVKLAEKDGVTQADLSRLLGIKTQSMGPHLRSLEENGLVVRRDNPNDRRSSCIFITSLGRDAASALQREERYSGSMFEVFDKEELAQLKRLVEKLTARLTEEYEATLAYDSLTNGSVGDGQGTGAVQ